MWCLGILILKLVCLNANHGPTMWDYITLGKLLNPSGLKLPCPQHGDTNSQASGEE